MVFIGLVCGVDSLILVGPKGGTVSPLCQLLDCHTRCPFVNFIGDRLNRINLALAVLRKTAMPGDLLQFHIRMNGKDSIAGVVENTVNPV